MNCDADVRGLNLPREGADLSHVRRTLKGAHMCVEPVHTILGFQLQIYSHVQKHFCFAGFCRQFGGPS